MPTDNDATVEIVQELDEPADGIDMPELVEYHLRTGPGSERLTGDVAALQERVKESATRTDELDEKIEESLRQLNDMGGVLGGVSRRLRGRISQ